MSSSFDEGAAIKRNATQSCEPRVTAGASPVWKLLGKKPLANTALALNFGDVPDPIAVKARMPRRSRR